MDSVQFHVILNHLQATAVLIAAAIVGLGRLQESAQEKHLTLAARGHTPEYPSRAASQRGAGGPPGASNHGRRSEEAQLLCCRQ